MRTKQPKEGEVYLIKFFDTGHYKIGMSTQMEVRLKQLGCPSKAEFIHSIKTDDVAQLEEFYHLYFKSRSLGGELFSLNNDDITRFKLLSEYNFSSQGWNIQKYLDENDPIQEIEIIICCPYCGTVYRNTIGRNCLSPFCHSSSGFREWDCGHSFESTIAVWSNSIEIVAHKVHGLPGMHERL